MSEAKRPSRPWPSLEERLWRQVDRTGDCWLWTGNASLGGYGSIGVSPERRRELVHRVVWELTHGPIPEDRHVSRLCGQKLCVRPSHLQLSATAPEPPRPRLTAKERVKIRAALASGKTHREFANRFHVSAATIGRIARRVENGH